MHFGDTNPCKDEIKLCMDAAHALMSECGWSESPQWSVRIVDGCVGDKLKDRVDQGRVIKSFQVSLFSWLKTVSDATRRLKLRFERL